MTVAPASPSPVTAVPSPAIVTLGAAGGVVSGGVMTVSYTHLTLPTNLVV